MNPDDASPRLLLDYYRIRPRKALGQHFLADAGPVRAAIEAAELGPGDTVLEIGPGLGILTDALSRAAGRVVAVELDAQMRKVLADQLGQRENLTVVDADILSVDPAELVGAPAGARGRLAGYKVVANLPYQITSAILRHLLDARVRPERIVVMVQREVAERIVAADGKMSILAAAVQLYGRATIVARVPASAFLPPPKVDSAILRLDLYEAPAEGIRDLDAFFRLVRAGFSQKRKQVKNSLAGGLGIAVTEAVGMLEAAGIEPSRRAETLALAEWARLIPLIPPEPPPGPAA